MILEVNIYKHLIYIANVELLNMVGIPFMVTRSGEIIHVTSNVEMHRAGTGESQVIFHH